MKRYGQIVKEKTNCYLETASTGAFSAYVPRAGGIAAAPRMDGKFTGIDAFFVLNYAHGG
jgi:hypothetical protein